MIKISNLTKTYQVNHQPLLALDNISMAIEDKSITGIIGMSGAGKSTLLRVLSGLVSPDSGGVLIDGMAIMDMDAKELRSLRKRIGVVFQGYQLLMQKNVFRNIAFPLEIAGYDQEYIQNRVYQLIDLVGLSGKELQYPAKLSGGQMQRVAIARAMATNPSILLCDEPTSALDSVTTKEIMKLLVQINQKENVTIIIVTHEVGIVRSICNQVIVLNEGKIEEEGLVSTVFSNPKAPITKLLLGKEY